MGQSKTFLKCRWFSNKLERMKGLGRLWLIETAARLLCLSQATKLTGSLIESAVCQGDGKGP